MHFDFHHLDSWYNYHSQSWVVYGSALTTVVGYLIMEQACEFQVLRYQGLNLILCLYETKLKMVVSGGDY